MSVPNTYVVLPSGWYYLHKYNNKPVPVEEVLLAVCPSELDEAFHYELCRKWSVREDNWVSIVDWFTNDVEFYNYDDEDDDEGVFNMEEDENEATIRRAANCLTLIDHQIRHVFGEEVFSQRSFKPWSGRGVINIEEQNVYYLQNGLENPCKYSRIIKLPLGYDVNRINYFCKTAFITNKCQCDLIKCA